MSVVDLLGLKNFEECFKCRHLCCNTFGANTVTTLLCIIFRNILNVCLIKDIALYCKAVFRVCGFRDTVVNKIQRYIQVIVGHSSQCFNWDLIWTYRFPFSLFLGRFSCLLFRFLELRYIQFQFCLFCCLQTTRYYIMSISLASVLFYSIYPFASFEYSWFSFPNGVSHLFNFLVGTKTVIFLYSLHYYYHYYYLFTLLFS